MKYLFFLIPLIFIPLSVDAYRGLDYEEIINGDGTTTQTLGLPPFIFDGNQYIPFIYFENSTLVQIETNHGSVTLDKNTCKFNFYNNGLINGNRLLGDFVIPLQSTDGINFNQITQITSETCQASWNGSELTAKKQAIGTGTVEYKYVLNNGVWKTQLEAKNESGLNDRYFGFTQTINLERDTINFGGSQKNLDNFDGTAFDRTFLENNKAKVINLLNGFSFDFDLAFDNLNSVTITDTGPNKSRLMFDYTFNPQILPDGQTLILDPTYSETDNDSEFYRDDNNSTCGDFIFDFSSTDLAGGWFSSAGNICYRGVMQWDISSIPDAAIINDVVFRFEVSGVDASREPCQFRHLANNITTSSNLDMMADARDGNLYVSGSAECQTDGTNKSVDLGSLADSDLKTQLTTTDRFGIGVTAEDETDPGSTDNRFLILSVGTPNAILEVTYNSELNLIIEELDVFRSTSTTLESGTPICLNVNLTSSSTCSSLFSGEDYRFEINVTNTGTSDFTPTFFEFDDVVASSDVLGSILAGNVTNSGCSTNTDWTPSIVGNDVNATAGTTCLIQNTTGWAEFWVVVTLDTDAATGSGSFLISNGTTSDSSTSTTFDLDPLSNAVTDLTTSDITFSTVDLSWTEPNLNDGILIDYQINFTTPFGLPATIVANHTGSTSASYTVSDLTLITNYSFRVAPWIQTGNNATGNIANATTLGQIFTVGQISVNQTNPNIIDIRFSRTDVNSTTTRVDVIYSNMYNLTCTLDHRFARTSQNYSNLDVTVVDSSTSSSSFFFINHTNDLVNMYCFNEDDSTNDGRFQVTWTNFPLLDQFANFRSGVYGTQGLFGVIDFITLAVIIFSMIGLNRVNESVGIIFNIALLGALAYFGIIELPTVIFGALVVVLIFGVASTRKR